MGISNKFINMIRKMYESVKVWVRSMHTLSDFFDSHAGVKQREPLSPLLFIILSMIWYLILQTLISQHTLLLGFKSICFFLQMILFYLRNLRKICRLFLISYTNTAVNGIFLLILIKPKQWYFNREIDMKM